MTSKRKSKFSIFDYYEAYQQNKTQDGPLPREENKEDTEKEKTKISQNKEICEEKMDVENESIKSIQLISDSNKNSDIQNQPSCSFTSNDQKEIVFTDTFRKNNKSVQNSNILNDNNVPSSSKFSESEPKNVSQDNLHKIATVTSKHSLEINVNNLNKKIEVTESLTVPSDPQAKKDLFKAIFLSSDESESEKEDEEQNKEEEKLTEMKKIVLEDTIKPANLPEQNTSEKSNRPVAKGFFADLDLSKLKKSTETSVEEVTNKAKQKTDNKTDVFDNFYGPKLPINNAGPQRIIFSKKTDRTTKTKDIVDDGQWVEADIKKNKKDKSHKKHKKHKDKDKPKKHKSKHKKSKYSDSD